MFFYLLLTLCIYPVSCQNAVVSEQCNNLAGNTDIPADQLFIFSDSFKPCPDPSFPANLQLDCDSSDDGYLRLALQYPAGINGTSPVRSAFTIDMIGTESSPCFYYTDSCAKKGCSKIDPIHIATVTGPLYIRHTLSLVKKIPFSFLPVEDYASPSACNSTAACKCEYAPTTFPNGVSSCSISDDVTSLVNNCGAMADPVPSGADRFPSILNNACNTVCCGSCNSSANGEHKRWAVGPVCGIYQVSGGVWTTDVSVVASVENLAPTTTLGKFVLHMPDVTIGNTVLNGTVGGSTSNEARLYVNEHFSPHQSSVGESPFQNTGFVVVCDYNINGTEDAMGPSNPYVHLQPPLDVSAGTLHVELNEPRYRAPPINSSPSALGAGKVPTQTSINTGLSLFYLSYDTLSGYTAGDGSYSETQSEVLSRWQRVGEKTFQDNAYWDQKTGVPGWDQSSLARPVYSPCQLSHQINAYAKAFNDALLLTPNDPDAAFAAAGPPPSSLMPGFDIRKPSWWVDFSQDEKYLYFDASTRVTGANAAYEIFLDIPQKFVRISSTGGAVDFTSSSSCIVNHNTTSGSFVAYVQNTNIATISSVQQSVSVSVFCNATYANGTSVNITTSPAVQNDILVPPEQTVQSKPFTFSIPTGETPTVSCSANGTVTVSGVKISTEDRNCYRALQPGDLTAQWYNYMVGDPTKTSCKPWDVCFIMLYIVLPTIVVLGLLVVLVMLIECCKKRSKTKTE